MSCVTNGQDFDSDVCHIPLAATSGVQSYDVSHVSLRDKSDAQSYDPCHVPLGVKSEAQRSCKIPNHDRDYLSKVCIYSDSISYVDPTIGTDQHQPMAPAGRTSLMGGHAHREVEHSDPILRQSDIINTIWPSVSPDARAQAPEFSPHRAYSIFACLPRERLEIILCFGVTSPVWASFHTCERSTPLSWAGRLSHPNCP